MLYWLPRIVLLALVAVVLAFGLMPVTSQDVASTLLVVLVGLGLFSLTMHVFPPERY